MPLFNLTCVERFEYTTTYSDIEADSLEEAIEQAVMGEVEYDDKDDGEYDSFVAVLSAEQDGEAVPQERVAKAFEDYNLVDDESGNGEVAASE